MKASELIKLLEKQIKSSGDVIVAVYVKNEMIDYGGTDRIKVSTSVTTKFNGEEETNIDIVLI